MLAGRSVAGPGHGDRVVGHRPSPRKRSCGRCIRGILCSNCNVGLGNFHDSPELLKAAISYLLAYSARKEGHTSSTT